MVRPVKLRLLHTAFLLGLAWGISGLATGCTANSTKKTYVLAEKLWTDGKYAAAVTEFEKVTAREPAGKLGLQALYRAASTQAYFLSQYSEAVRKFRVYVQLVQDPGQSWEARREIGEILYSRLEAFDQAISHYRAMVRDRPDSREKPEFLFRIGKSQFHLWQFDEAIQTFQQLYRLVPDTPWGEKSLYEIGNTHFTRGEQHPGGEGPGLEAYQEAIDAYERFLKVYPKSSLAPQAHFGIASSLEEMDQLDAALVAYRALLTTYPSPNVIRIKLHRIRERKEQRSR